VVSIFAAALGAWFGGWVDGLVQGITEVNIMLPIFPVSVMAYYMYGKNVWIAIGAIILVSILGNSTKNYRAAFLQIKDAPYIESASAYGASSWRIITRYLAPRIVPVMVPQLVAMVPGYVFLEATLSIMGVTDPYIPTWGNVIYDALANGAFSGYYYWIIEPIGLLLVTGLVFALVGFALDRVFNPRLRSL
jgi:peptide/nickel transport system permease protein